jgi:hypothetical protein
MSLGSNNYAEAMDTNKIKISSARVRQVKVDGTCKLAELERAECVSIVISWPLNCPKSMYRKK